MDKQARDSEWVTKIWKKTPLSPQERGFEFIFSHIITNMEKTTGDVSYIIHDVTVKVSVNLFAFLSQLQEEGCFKSTHHICVYISRVDKRKQAEIPP